MQAVGAGFSPRPGGRAAYLRRVLRPRSVTLTPVQQLIVDDVVRLARPLRVVVFGSVARGEAGPASDLDLLVVMPDGAPRRATAQRLYVDVPRRGMALDLVVATPAVLASQASAAGFVYGPALREGVQVYAV